MSYWNNKEKDITEDDILLGGKFEETNDWQRLAYLLFKKIERIELEVKKLKT